MTKQEALALIDAHKNALINPVAMLNWTWLRLTILHVSEEAWMEAAEAAAKDAAR
jgi:hypothetical protein